MIELNLYPGIPPSLRERDDGSKWIEIVLDLELAPDGIWAIEEGSLTISTASESPVPLDTRVYVDEQEATRERAIVLENGKSQRVAIAGAWGDAVEAISPSGTDFILGVVLHFKGKATVPVALELKRHGIRDLQVREPLGRSDHAHHKIRAVVALFSLSGAIIAIWGSQADDIGYTSTLFKFLPLPLNSETQLALFTAFIGGAISIGAHWTGLFKGNFSQLFARLGGRWRFPEAYLDPMTARILHGRTAILVASVILVVTILFAFWQWPVGLPTIEAGSSPNLVFYNMSHPDTILTNSTRLLGSDLGQTHVAYRAAVESGRPIPVCDVTRGDSVPRCDSVRVQFRASGTTLSLPWDVSHWETSEQFDSVYELKDAHRSLGVLQIVIENGEAIKPSWIHHESDGGWMLYPPPMGSDSVVLPDYLTLLQTGRAVRRLVQSLESEPFDTRKTYWEELFTAEFLRERLISFTDSNLAIHPNFFQRVLTARLQHVFETSHKPAGEPINSLLGTFALASLYVEQRGELSGANVQSVLDKYSELDSLLQIDLEGGNGQNMIDDKNLIWTYWRFLTWLALRTARDESESVYDSVHVAIHRTAGHDAFYMGNYLQAGILSNVWKNWRHNDGEWRKSFHDLAVGIQGERLPTSTVNFFNSPRERGYDFPVMRASLFNQAQRQGRGSLAFVCALCRAADAVCPEVCIPDHIE